MASDTRQEVILRLKKIEGQIRGLQGMIDENRDCTEVIHQLSAARKALDKVGFIILTHRMQECLKEKQIAGYDQEKSMEEAMKLFLTLA
ncbi:MAG: metal-sensitive transcriptional regulator [Armatimonadota bacterium]